MNKKVKVLVIVASCMIVIGVVLALVGGINGGIRTIHLGRGGISVAPGGNIDDEKKEMPLAVFENIQIEVDRYEVEFVPSNEYKLEYAYIKDHGDLNVSVDNKTLKIIEPRLNNFNLDIFDGLDLLTGNKKPFIKVYYPESVMLGTVDIEQGMGSFMIKDAKMNRLDIDMDMGDVEIDSVVTDILKVKADAGDCNIVNTSAISGSLFLDSGNLTSEKFYTKGLEAEADAGSLKLNGIFEGESSIYCDMGSVKINTGLLKSEYSYELKVDMGSIKVDGESTASGVVHKENAPNHLKVEADMGPVDLNFGHKSSL